MHGKAQYNNFNRGWAILLMLVLFVSRSDAQSRRFAIDTKAGVMYMQSSIKSNPSACAGIGLRYNPTRYLAVQGCVDAGAYSGTNTHALGTSANDARNFVSYKGSFAMLSGNIQFNLAHYQAVRSFTDRLNPYLVFGMGWMMSDVKAVRWDSRERSFAFPTYVSQVGICARYFLSPTMDLNGRVMANISQTYYLDGIAADKKFDHFVFAQIGLTVKIGANRTYPHIEWENLVRWGNRSLCRGSQF